MASSYPWNSYSSFSKPLKEKLLLEKTMKFVQESERQIQNMFDFHCLLNFHMTQESCHFENHASISLCRSKLDQNQILDILASYPFSEIELERECDSNSQVGNSISLFDSIMTLVSLQEFFHISELTLNHVPVYREI